MATWVTTGAGLMICILTLNSGLAISCARGDAASVLFVASSYATLILLFRYLRAYDERAPPGSPERELTAAFSSPRDGAAGAGHPMDRQVAAALMMAALGAMACDSALAVHDARGDVASAAAVLVAYAALLGMSFRFLRAFADLARGQ